MAIDSSFQSLVLLLKGEQEMNATMCIGIDVMDDLKQEIYLIRIVKLAPRRRALFFRNC